MAADLLPPGALRGQESALEAFESALRTDRVGAAYLLHGPEGVGRSLGARILAHALLCQAPRGLQACGACRACRWNAAGTHADLLVVSATHGPFFKDDAAAARSRQEEFLWAAAAKEQDGPRRGIPVRTLRRMTDLLGLRAAGGGRKVVLLDAFDEVEEEGAATLLKILEEPPPKTTFLVLAGGVERVPDTILSRTQRLRFRPLPPELVREILLSAGGKSARSLPEGAVDLLVRLGQGSPGRALEALKLGAHEAAWDAARALVTGEGGPAVAGAARWIQQGARTLADQRRKLRLLLALALLALRDRLAAEGTTAATEAISTAIAGALESVDANVTPELVLAGLSVRTGRAERG